MSQFSPALEYVLDFEDEPRSYEPSDDPGGFAIAGVNSAAWPAEYATIAAVPQPQRAGLVAAFYQANFWNPLQIGGVNDQDVANRVLDTSVNEGPVWGPKVLQMAANTLGCTLLVDGELGPNTFAAVNGLSTDSLLAAIRTVRANRYQKIAAANPADEKYLDEWLARARA